MKKWCGSAAICLNKHSQLLMVYQSWDGVHKSWAVPSGGREKGETFRDCCRREVEEETGYQVSIIKKIAVKKRVYIERQIIVEVHFYLVEIVGGQPMIQDPDQLIYDIAWKPKEELNDIQLSYPEDKDFLLDCIEKFGNTASVSI